MNTEKQNSMTLNEYQTEAYSTAIYMHRMYPVTSIMVESAELADLFIKPLLRGDKKQIQQEQVMAEAGDVLWNLACLLHDNGITLSEVAEYNIKKLKSRMERGVIQGDGDER